MCDFVCLHLSVTASFRDYTLHHRQKFRQRSYFLQYWYHERYFQYWYHCVAVPTTTAVATFPGAVSILSNIFTLIRAVAVVVGMIGMPPLVFTNCQLQKNLQISSLDKTWNMSASALQTRPVRKDVHPKPTAARADIDSLPAHWRKTTADTVLALQNNIASAPFTHNDAAMPLLHPGGPADATPATVWSAKTSVQIGTAPLPPKPLSWQSEIHIYMYIYIY